MMNSAAVAERSSESSDSLITLGRLKEFEAILTRNSMGRIAFAVDDRVSILPVQYVCTGGWIYGRTTATAQFRALLRNRRVVFEVDEHTPSLEWTSVAVRGPLHLIEASTTDSDQHLFRIRIVEISGRSSGPAAAKKRFPVA
jgi:nitroimidazol reductase NimA-like FMN-containing flavoprotein (pyridoxamine 5'-phosphate oxidase superfamily)